MTTDRNSQRRSALAIPAMLAVLTLLCAIDIAGAAPIMVFANAAQKPKAYIDHTGNMRGYAIETAQAVLQDAGIEYKLVGLSFPHALQSTKECRGLMTGVFASDERKKYLIYSDAIVSEDVVLVTRADDPFVYSRPGDLKGKNIISMTNGYFGGDNPLLSASTLYEQADQTAMIKRLMLGTVDIVIMNPREAVEIASMAAGVPMTKLHISKKPLAVIQDHIAACKTDPDQVALIRRINQSITRLKANGALNRIMGKYRKAG